MNIITVFYFRLVSAVIQMGGPWSDECYQTLIHRAIDENNEHAACFLIRRLNLKSINFLNLLFYMAVNSHLFINIT